MKNTTRAATRLLPIALKRAITQAMVATAALAAFNTVALAQQYHGDAQHSAGAQAGGPTLHVNPRWKECSFQLDASLTQAAWRQFTGEAGVVTYFRPLSGAEPMGKGRFEVSVLQWETAIDDSDAAWNDTFVHPDSTHWLFEGNSLAFPGLTARMGVSDRTDVGVYVTKALGANYGFYGAQVQHNLAQDADKRWSAAGRVSFVSMYGPEDLEFSVYGMDLVASRRFDVFRRVSISPYAVASASLSRSQEKSAVVDLMDENVLGVQGTVGASARISVATIAVEYAASRVNSFSLKVGFGALP